MTTHAAAPKCSNKGCPRPATPGYKTCERCRTQSRAAQRRLTQELSTKTHMVRCPVRGCYELMKSGARDCGGHGAERTERPTAHKPSSIGPVTPGEGKPSKERDEGIIFTPWVRKAKPMSEAEERRLNAKQEVINRQVDAHLERTRAAIPPERLADYLRQCGALV